jgi:hypothetical protein
MGFAFAGTTRLGTMTSPNHTNTHSHIRMRNVLECR